MVTNSDWIKRRKWKAVLAAIAFAVMSICNSMGHAMEFLVSEDFDLIAGAPGTLHTVRVHALTQGATLVTVSYPPALGLADQVATLAEAGEYRDWPVPVGAKLTTDKPALAVLYDAADYAWSESFAGRGVEINVPPSQYAIIAAASDATGVSVDISDSGSPQSVNLNAGCALMVNATAGKAISATKEVSVFSFDSASPFLGAYFLTPGIASYTPLTAPTLHIINDLGETISSLRQDQGVIARTARFFVRAVAGVFSLVVSDAHAAATETNVDNGDGTFTFTQKIDKTSSAPHYTKPETETGFSVRTKLDFGWQHSFPYNELPQLNISKVTLTIRAFDVDSKNGESDVVQYDGIFPNPKLLQGVNNKWSTTTFNLDGNNLLDGLLDIILDIDGKQSNNWITEIGYSELKVVYSYSDNRAPFTPVLFISPSGCTYSSDTLAVTVDGSAPADPDGDAVTYAYRWLVDVGTGEYIDDEIAERSDHIGNTVPAWDIRNGDNWMVEVFATDAHGARSNLNSLSFATIGGCNAPPASNPGANIETYQAAVTFDGSASQDQDGNIVAYRWELYEVVNGVWVWTTFGESSTASYTFRAPGTYTVRLTVTDNHGAADDALLYVTVKPNQPPVADAGEASTLEATGPVTTPVTLDGSLSTDPDGDTLSYTWSGSFETATGVSPTLLLPVGVHTITLTVDDGKGLVATDTVQVTVTNPAPVIGGTPGTAVLRGETYSFALDARDPNGENLIYEIVAAPQGAALSGGIFTWTPSLTDVAKTYEVVLTVSDSSTAAEKRFSITVTNRAPAITEVPPQVVRAGTLYSFTPTGTDPDGEAVTCSIASLPGSATFSDGCLSWTPTAADVGTHNITIMAYDGHETTTLTFAVTVEPPLPPCTAPAIMYIPETNSTGTFTVAWATSTGTGITGPMYVLEQSYNNGGYSKIYEGTDPRFVIRGGQDGAYSYRVKAKLSGYSDSPFMYSEKPCTVTLACSAPSYVTVPATSSTGTFTVSWSSSNLPDVTYVLEERVNGTTKVFYPGTATQFAVTVTQDGLYTYAVKVLKTGYLTSDYATASCNVTISAPMPSCGASPIIYTPATNASGTYTVSWGTSPTTGVTYHLLQSSDGGVTYNEIYYGTTARFVVSNAANGTYQYQVYATKVGYNRSSTVTSSSCTVDLTCSAPSYITVPASSSTGTYTVSWATSSTPGVTYVLQESSDGWQTYSETRITSASLKLTKPSGSYSYRVKTTKSGFKDSPYKTGPAPCIVTTP